MIEFGLIQLRPYCSIDLKIIIDNLNKSRQPAKILEALNYQRFKISISTLQSGSFDQLNDFKGFVDFGTFLRTAEPGMDVPNCPLFMSTPATPMIAVFP